MFQLNKPVFLLLLFLLFDIIIVRCEIEYNTINEDGSFSFRHTNDDIGGFYHSASGTPDNVVRGRYGSRNPATGQVDEIVYTAGPRGYRVNGPKIHRKTDLAQFPVPPRGSPDDPLADPFDTPAYSFKFRTPDQTKTEENDETGRVRGLYSYIDDIGERHSVRYAAGAGIGFQVSNAIADTPAAVGYAAPLYKAHPQTRGKTAVQRGPNGSYKLIAAGPDHRRAESRGSDGLVRGTYSYLDDKGVQRTVEYIAGAGIGYRVVQNSVGPGTHVNPSVSDFRLNDADFKLANDFGRGAGGGSGFAAGAGGGSDRPNGSGGDGEYLKIASSGSISSGDDSDGGDDEGNANLRSGSVGSDKGVGGGGLGVVAAAMGKTGSKVNLKNDRMGAAAASVSRGNTRFDGGGNAGNEDSYDAGADRNSASEGGSVGAKLGGRGGNRPSSNRNALAADRAANRDRARNRNRDRFSGTASAGGSKTRQGGGYNYQPSSSSSNNNYNLNDDDVGGSLPPLITANRKILEMERRRDWIDRQRDSTIIQNVGKWYIGLPPGQSVRAHVQNIDLLPLGSRHVPSPAEALRQDEIADMVASLESGSGLMRSPAFRSS